MSASKIAAVALGFLLGSVSAVSAASAGVVMSETAVTAGIEGNQTIHRTIYIQGSKQKVDADGVQTITDLDRRLLYVVDKAHKNFVELPLASMNGALDQATTSGQMAVVLKRTGGTQVVAAHRCDEYRGRQSNAQLQITVSACVSTSAPGASEISSFDRRMISQLIGSNPGIAREQSAGVVLQKKSVVNLRVSDHEEQGYRTASLMTKTTVNSIRVKPLAEQTFAPPKGYAQVGNEPPDLPEGVQSTMISRPFVNS